MMMKVHPSLSFAVIVALAMVMVMAAGDVAAAAGIGGNGGSSSSDITSVARRAEFQRLRMTPSQKRSISTSMFQNVNRHGTSISTNTPFDGGTTAVAMIPRGGGGGDIVLTPTLVAKMVTMLGGATGLLFTLAPTKAMEQYGVPKDSASLPMSTFMTKACGTGILSYAVVAYFLLFTDQSSLQSAGQVAYIPWALWHLDNALNNDPSTKNDKKDTPLQNPQVSKIMVGVCALCMYTAGQVRCIMEIPDRYLLCGLIHVHCKTTSLSLKSSSRLLPTRRKGLR